MDNTSVIILASGNISRKLPYLKSETACPALIPLNTRPVAAYIFDFYLTQRIKHIYLVIQEEFKHVVNNELSFYKDKIEIVCLPETRNVNDTLYKALESIKPKGNVIVNLVTTVPVKLPSLNTIYLADGIQHLVNCAYIESNTKHFYATNEQIKKGQPFTGLFCVNAEKLFEAVRSIRTERDQIVLIKHLDENNTLHYKKTEWIDCGHETNYYEAKQKLISSRSFNRVDLLQSGVVQKRSYDVKKLEHEYRYVKMLPETLKIYFPRYWNFYHEDNKYARFSMEYYGYPNVAELLLYWDLSKESWTKFFLQMKALLTQFQTYAYSISEKAYMNFHVEKLKRRINELEQQDNVFQKLISEEQTVNGMLCKPVKELLPMFEKRVRSFYGKTNFCIMHGDLCFNNILYDYTSGIVKLIDARGSMGDLCIGVYGDPLYDMAKLAHSALGQYDYLVNHLFTLESDSNMHKLTFYERKNQAFVAEACESLFQEMGYQLEDIYIVMAGLFLSMPPLHKDNSEKQKAMYLHGLKLLNENI